MNYYKKRNFKEKIKKNKGIIIGTTAFGLMGLFVLLFGFIFGGWNIIEWITGPLGISFFIMLFFFLIGAGIIIYIFSKKDDNITYDKD